MNTQSKKKKKIQVSHRELSCLHVLKGREPSLCFLDNLMLFSSDKNNSLLRVHVGGCLFLTQSLTSPTSRQEYLSRLQFHEADDRYLVTHEDKVNAFHEKVKVTQKYLKEAFPCVVGLVWSH